jgi:hypothetical protein
VQRSNKLCSLTTRQLSGSKYLVSLRDSIVTKWSSSHPLLQAYVCGAATSSGTAGRNPSTITITELKTGAVDTVFVSGEVRKGKPWFSFLGGYADHALLVVSREVSNRLSRVCFWKGMKLTPHCALCPLFPWVHSHKVHCAEATQREADCIGSD